MVNSTKTMYYQSSDRTSHEVDRIVCICLSFFVLICVLSVLEFVGGGWGLMVV
jgi:hypothetical protein